MQRCALWVLTLALAACAAPAGSTPRPDNAVITQAEIAEAGTSNAYQLVQKLRPIWLQTRGRTSFTDTEQDVAVYLDGTRIGLSEELRSLQTHDIESVQYLTPNRANNRFGPGHVHGVILVVTKS